MRFLASYIMRGRVQAIMAVSVFAFLSLKLPPLSLLSTAGIALVALRKGSAESLLIVGGAATAISLFGLFWAGNLPLVLGYGLAIWVPVVLMALVLRETGDLGLTVELFVGFGVVCVAAAYLLISEPAVLWNDRLQSVVEVIFKGASIDVQKQLQIKDSIELMSHYMSGFMVIGAMASFLVALLLGRWWQSLLYHPGGFGEEFLGLKTHRVFAYTSIAFVLIASSSEGIFSEAAWNMAIITVGLYSMVGVSVLHKIISATRMKQLVLTLFYLIMFFVPQALVPVVIVGFTDSWLDWRRKFSVG